MSWVFALLLAAYGVVRTVLWVRGQVLYRFGCVRLVPPASRTTPPSHLSSDLRRFYESTDELRVRLVDDRRQIGRVSITDPDAPLGHVRDGRFRWALLDAWLRLRRWRRELEAMRDHTTELVLMREHLDVSRSRLDRALRRLQPVWWQAVRARALDPFLIEHVRAADAALATIVLELERLCAQLGCLATDPYRGGSARAAAQTPVELAG